MNFISVVDLLFTLTKAKVVTRLKFLKVSIYYSKSPKNGLKYLSLSWSTGKK